jgi:hypothetical protein
MSYRDVIKAASKIVNNVLGVLCDYEHKDGAITNNIFIAINKNKELKGDFGIIAGLYIEASILKSDVEKVRPDDMFTDDCGQKYKVTELTKETTAKTYANVIEIL